MLSAHVTVHIDPGHIRRNAATLAASVGVPLWAVIKADAYGLGAAQIAPVLTDYVDGFCLFSLEEAERIDLWRLTGKPAITLGPPSTLDPRRWLAAHVRPAVSTVDQAARLRDANPILCIDTGMQRFACPSDQIDRVIEAGQITEAFTHATRLEQVDQFLQLTASRSLKRHAAATALLDQPSARLDAVRPGLALYRGAVRATTPLVEARPSSGPIGYTGWNSETGRHGVIVAGYSNGLRPGPLTINGRRQRIMEVGMQSAYVTLHPDDRPGDTVELLGQQTESDIAFAWGVTPHHALLVLSTMGRNDYQNHEKV